jgi:3-phytase
MCIWVHPTDTSLSTIVTSDKAATKVFVYDLFGNTLQRIAAPGMPGNIDVRYGFPLDGELVDIVAWNDRANRKVIVYAVDPGSRQLSRVDDDAMTIGSNYGFCLYRSHATGSFHAYVAATNGSITQYLLSESGGRVTGSLVRAWDLGTQTEGCVADDEEGVVFLGEENVGIWKVGAEPADPTSGTLIAQVGDASSLQADVEGLALYYAAGGGGYLIASSQGSDDFRVYERRAPHAFVKSFTISGVSGTDGVDVTNVDLGASFPMGILTVHNNSPSRKTVEVCGYEDLGLTVDTTYWDPRAFGTSPVNQASWGSIKSRFRPSSSR